jgi:hypothetical protein
MVERRIPRLLSGEVSMHLHGNYKGQSNEVLQCKVLVTAISDAQSFADRDNHPLKAR